LAKTFTRLTDGSSTSTATSYASASISPASGSTLFSVFVARSANLASVATETPTITGVMGAWGDAGAGIQIFDASSRMFAQLFKGTGSVTAEAITYGTVSNRSLDRGVWYIVEVSATGAISVVQAAKATGNSTSANLSLSAWADPANSLLLFVVTDTNTSDISAEGGHTALDSLGSTDRFAAYLDGEDTSPTASLNPGREWVIFAVELNEAGGGGGPTARPQFISLLGMGA
jgi:hypothetical protein